MKLKILTKYEGRYLVTLAQETLPNFNRKVGGLELKVNCLLKDIIKLKETPKKISTPCLKEKELLF